MNGKINRPAYFEGQILTAADLDLGLGYGRGQRARHNRYLHDWGIAEGLSLTRSDRTTAGGVTYVDVNVSPGMAIDGTGRELVLPEEDVLSVELFDQLNIAIADPDAWYPVFIRGRDERVAAPASFSEACGVGQPNRFAESYELTFGRKGDELSLDEQEAPAVNEGAGQGWNVLLGFVKWNATISRFSDLADSADGIGRRYAGVRADSVTARGDQLAIRTANGDNGKPALVLDAGEDGTLSFGQLDAKGAVTPVFTVNGKGDVSAEGKITSAVAAGVHVASGVAFDGMLLPLPAGVSEAQVSSGQAVLHAHVTPRYLGRSPDNATLTNIMTPLECRTEGRRVFCRVRWEKNGGGFVTLPGSCDYTLLAFVAPD